MKSLVAFAFASAVGLALACGPNTANVCSSSTTSDPSSCTDTFNLCNGSTYVLKCNVSNTGNNCDCIQNGSKAVSFNSPDICQVSPDTRKTSAAKACNWNLDETP